MYLYSIMPLDKKHIEERCADIKKQYESGFSNCALFSFVLDPEGNPVMDKAGIQCEVYEKYVERLKKDNLECGVLLQATIGHGRPKNQQPPFQCYINLSDGVEQTVVCPEDEGFLEYIEKSVEKIASYNPKAIMVDDDLRLTRRKGRGCACPKHMKMFNEKAGLNFSREELYEYVTTHPLDDPIVKIFFEVQDSSLIKAAKAIRKGIDKVNPKIQGVQCGVMQPEIIENILKGEGNPSIVRISNGCYTLKENRFIFTSIYQAAFLIQSLNGKIDYTLAEADACPQNRYSIGAYGMHTHFVGSVLEGVNGAKRWMTRHLYGEQKSEKPFKDILSKYSKYYEELAKLAKELKPFGARISMPKKIIRYELMFENPYQRVISGFAEMVLSRYGVPLYFSADEGGIPFIDEIIVDFMTDEEIRSAFKGKVFLSALAAKRLIERGFKDNIGVDVEEWNGLPIRYEYDNISKRAISTQVGCHKLVPLSDKVEEIGTAYSTDSEGKEKKEFPSVTKFKNPSGGTTVTFCGSPCAKFDFREAFSFLCETRKDQILALMNEGEALPVYYPDDAEMYMKAGYLNNGEIMCALFNFGVDRIEQLPLVINKKITKAEILVYDGTRKEISFKEENKNYVFDLTVHPVDPVILFLK